MLTIHEGFPIKKMALYGSAAFIVGFTGTLTMLRQYAPKDESGNISVVHPSNKQEAKSNVSNQVPKTEKQEEGKTLDPAAPLVSSTPVTGGTTVPTRQASPVPITYSNGATGGGTMSVAPATSAPTPVVSSSPQPVGGSGSTSTTSTTTQPAPTSGSTSPLITAPDLHQTVNSLEDTTTSILP